MCVVSNKPDFAIADLMTNFFPGRFDFALGQRDDLKRKPDAEPVHYALAQIGVDPQDAVYIGDSEVDVATARNSGMPCISVTWGFRDKRNASSCRCYHALRYRRRNGARNSQIVALKITTIHHCR